MTTTQQLMDAAHAFQADITSMGMDKPANRVAEPESRLEREFRRFDAEHPDIFKEFRRYCRVLRDTRGFRHYSARTIISVMRFHSDVDGRPDDEFKLNNNWSPYYARKLVALDPSYRDFFQFRVLKHDGRPVGFPAAAGHTHEMHETEED